MLVLSRKKHETIVIDNRIKITVIQLKGGAVRLGIEAPQDVDIHRAELAGRPGRALVAMTSC